MGTDVSVTPLSEDIFLASRALAEGPDVRAALLLGTERAAVLDTMTRPEDMAQFVELVAAHGRPVTVVNTHADWDHAWGNAAFANARVVGHKLCRQRLIGAEEKARLAQKQEEDPETYANARLVPPDSTFDAATTLPLGGMTLVLHHMPGHTVDSLVGFIPERQILLAGDSAEDPFPLLGSGPLESWLRDLRAWDREELQTVVPSHGAIGGPELLRANAAYLGSLADDPPVPEGVSAFYAEAHAANVAAARRLAAG